MSKTPFEESDDLDDDLLAEYDFDYREAKPNRFATREDAQPFKVVVLDEDVAQVFTTPESVNQVLRALIKTMPKVTSGESSQGI